MLISHLRNNLLVSKTSSLEAGAYGTSDNASQRVCLMRHGCKHENTGRVGNFNFQLSKKLWLIVLLIL